LVDGLSFVRRCTSLAVPSSTRRRISLITLRRRVVEHGLAASPPVRPPSSDRGPRSRDPPSGPASTRPRAGRRNCCPGPFCTPSTAPQPARPVRTVPLFQDLACLVERQARPWALSRYPSFLVGSISARTTPTTFLPRPDVPAPTCTSDWTFLISEVTPSCRSLDAASWTSQNCYISSPSGVTTSARESSTVWRIGSIPYS
jgi:hypothetical protein